MVCITVFGSCGVVPITGYTEYSSHHRSHSPVIHLSYPLGQSQSPTPPHPLSLVAHRDPLRQAHCVPSLALAISYTIWCQCSVRREMEAHKSHGYLWLSASISSWLRPLLITTPISRQGTNHHGDNQGLLPVLPW